MTPLDLAIIGCTGRMGRTLLRLAGADPSLRVVAALTRPDDPEIGADVATLIGGAERGVRVAADADVRPAVAVEFSRPHGSAQWAAWCAARGAALVSGTTGLGEAEHAALAEAARRVPVVWAPNMSVGVNVLLELVSLAAMRVGAGWDIEITETHHRNKVDAPSGTARALLAAVQEARGAAHKPTAVYGRSGDCGPRGDDEIGVYALRMGSVVGEHEVHIAAEGEVLTLCHRALSRDIFAAGALRAARWVATRPPGLYSMRDVLAPSAKFE